MAVPAAGAARRSLRTSLLRCVPARCKTTGVPAGRSVIMPGLAKAYFLGRRPPTQAGFLEHRWIMLLCYYVIIIIDRSTDGIRFACFASSCLRMLRDFPLVGGADRPSVRLPLHPHYPPQLPVLLPPRARPRRSNRAAATIEFSRSDRSYGQR